MMGGFGNGIITCVDFAMDHCHGNQLDQLDHCHGNHYEVYLIDTLVHG